MERKYDFIEVTLDNDNYKFIKEIYRLYKEQANKIFDLACGISTDEDIMDYIKNNIEYNITLLGIDTTNGEYAGVVVLDDVCVWYVKLYLLVINSEAGHMFPDGNILAMPPC